MDAAAAKSRGTVSFESPHNLRKSSSEFIVSEKSRSVSFTRFAKNSSFAELSQKNICSEPTGFGVRGIVSRSTTRGTGYNANFDVGRVHPQQSGFLRVRLGRQSAKSSARPARVSASRRYF